MTPEKGGRANPHQGNASVFSIRERPSTVPMAEKIPAMFGQSTPAEPLRSGNQLLRRQEEPGLAPERIGGKRGRARSKKPIRKKVEQGRI